MKGLNRCSTRGFHLARVGAGFTDYIPPFAETKTRRMGHPGFCGSDSGACGWDIWGFCGWGDPAFWLAEGVGVVGAGAAEVLVVAEGSAEGGVALEPGQEVVVAVFEDLALDGGVFAAENEDEGGAPAVQVFDHPGVLEAVELCEAVWGDEVRRGMTLGVLVAEDGGQDPEVVGALGHQEVVGGDGRDGVVDEGGEDGDRSSRGEVGEEGGVGGVGEAGGEA